MAVSGRWLTHVVLAGVSLSACGGPEEPLDEEVTEEHALRDDSCRPSPGGNNNDAANLATYWAYRERLRAEFVKVSGGDEPGTNIPASMRKNGTLSWGDSTIFMSQYIAMLATEYALVGGASTEKGLVAAKELTYALRALERLDRTAETYFPGGTATVNGFFIRDDVPGDFLARFPLRNASAVESDITCPFLNSSSCHTTYRATEMSQDQVWHLLMGLALVKRLVPDTVTIDGQSVNPRAYAKTLTDRMLRYMRDNRNWQTENPTNGRKVLRGAEWDARFVFSYGLATAGNWILAKDAPGDVAYPTLHNTASRAAKLKFQAAALIEGDNYNQRVLATVGDINYLVNPLAFVFGDTLYKLEHQVLSRKSGAFRYEHFPLVYVLLHGGNTRLSAQHYGGMLNGAPANGPVNHSDGTESCDWSSMSRVVWPERLNTREDWLLGEYNGIDYLLMHNLYQLVFNQAGRTTLYGVR